MLKVGVLGAGHLGKIHLKLLQQSTKYELIGFYDQDIENANKVADEFGYRYFESVSELIDAVEVVDIVTPTLSHFDCAKEAIEKGRHVFIEKPITNTVTEAEALKTLASVHHVKGQVGHVERFNPAFTAVKHMINDPMFIETHRLREFHPRGTDVPVVLDLMIHDIDIILSVVNSKIKKIHASGVSVISETPDIANARIQFENGCVANLTASRISLKEMRKSRFFQKDAYISVDFLSKKELYEKAKKYLPKIGYVAKKLSFGDGYKGWPAYAPFDKILVTAGAPEVPKALLSQLKVGGRLVIPVGDDIQIMTVYIRTNEKEFEKHEYGEFRFVPMLKESEK